MHDDCIISDQGTLQEVGLIVKRIEGRPCCNVPHKHKHHSTDGMEWGYGGSGPAELALNVLAELIPGKDVLLWDGSRVSAQAYSYHQEFKRDVIVELNREADFVSIAQIEDWIEQKVVKM